MAHDVFVSYSSKDKPVADAVVAGLESKGVRCWIAPRDVTPGTSWGDAIISAIEGSRLMVIILSENSNRSKQVVREVERAVANEEIIIPFRIENIDPTGAMAYFLSTEHWLDALTPPLEKHIEKLGNTIQLFLSNGDRVLAAQDLRAPTVKAPAPARRLLSIPIWTVLIGIVAVAALITFAVTQIVAKPSTPAPTSTSVSMLETIPTSTSTSPPTLTPIPPPEFHVVGNYRTSRSANALYISGNMLYLANGGDGLVRLNISNPTDLLPVDTYQVADAQEVMVADNIAYVITGEYSRQLNIIKLGSSGRSATFPAEGQGLGGARSIYDVTVHDGLAHLTGHNYWGILDVHDPLDPQELWNWEPESNSGNPCYAVIDETIAYIGGGWTGLHIFDFTDPESPELIGRYDTPDWITGMFLADEVLFMSMGESGLLSLDVSDPTRPLLMDNLDLPGFSSNLTVSGDRLYVIYSIMEDYVTIESGVNAIDITDPEALSIIATYNELDAAADVQAVEGTVYVADKNRGIVVMSFGETP